MSYQAGRMPIYVDLTTAKEDYTNAIFDSMTDPAVGQLCDLFGMHIITDLTQQTARGKRYFIGYDDNDPKFAIGWAINNTYANAFYLLCVGMFSGAYLVNTLDATGSSAINDSQYSIRLIIRDFSNTTNKYFYINYISDTNIKGISSFYAVQVATQTATANIVFCEFKFNSNKLMSYWYSDRYYTFDYLNNGLPYYICEPASFYTVKNIIANTDCDYISQAYLDHGDIINGLYIYSKTLTKNSIYRINGDMYFCLHSNNNYYSYLMKLSA